MEIEYGKARFDHLSQSVTTVARCDDLEFNIATYPTHAAPWTHIVVVLGGEILTFEYTACNEFEFARTFREMEDMIRKVAAIAKKFDALTAEAYAIATGGYVNQPGDLPWEPKQ